MMVLLMPSLVVMMHGAADAKPGGTSIANDYHQSTCVFPPVKSSILSSFLSLVIST
jgi:hypothetical protein